MELTPYQFLYIQTVYDYFQENFQWPTFRQVQKKHLSTHRDFRVLEVAKSIEGDLARHFPSGLEAPATLTLKEIHQLPQAQQDLDDLLKVIQYSVEKYIAEDKDGVRVTSEEISQNGKCPEGSNENTGLRASVSNLQGIYQMRRPFVRFSHC